MPLRAGAALALSALTALTTLVATTALAGGRAASGPEFSPRQRTAVLARLGDSVELSCRVLRLADRAVSWVRSSDLQILTHAGTVFTADSRVSCAESEPEQPAGGASLHTLRVARLRAGDAGRYECQVNTEPKMSLFFNLTVLESALPAVLVRAVRGAVRGARGGAARLACDARYEPPPDAAAAAALPPLRIAWQHDGRDIDPQSARGGVSLEAERWAGGASSRLMLAALTAADGGRYTCSAAGASADVALRVYEESEDEPAGEMQRDQAVARVSAGCAPRLPAGPSALLALAALAAVVVGGASAS